MSPTLHFSNEGGKEPGRQKSNKNGNRHAPAERPWSLEERQGKESQRKKTKLTSPDTEGRREGGTSLIPKDRRELTVDENSKRGWQKRAGSYGEKREGLSKSGEIPAR